MISEQLRAALDLANSAFAALRECFLAAMQLFAVFSFNVFMFTFIFSYHILHRNLRGFAKVDFKITLFKQMFETFPGIF